MDIHSNLGGEKVITFMYKSMSHLAVFKNHDPRVTQVD